MGPGPGGKAFTKVPRNAGTRGWGGSLEPALKAQTSPSAKCVYQQGQALAWQSSSHLDHPMTGTTHQQEECSHLWASSPELPEPCSLTDLPLVPSPWQSPQLHPDLAQACGLVLLSIHNPFQVTDYHLHATHFRSLTPLHLGALEWLKVNIVHCFI